MSAPVIAPRPRTLVEIAETAARAPRHLAPEELQRLGAWVLLADAELGAFLRPFLWKLDNNGTRRVRELRARLHRD